LINEVSFERYDFGRIATTSTRKGNNAVGDVKLKLNAAEYKPAFFLSCS
jgi:hypothetical protein